MEGIGRVDFLYMASPNPLVAKWILLPVDFVDAVLEQSCVLPGFAVIKMQSAYTFIFRTVYYTIG